MFLLFPGILSKSKAKKTPPPQRSEFYRALSGGLKHGTGHAFHGAEESLLGETIVADSFAVGEKSRFLENT